MRAVRQLAAVLVSVAGLDVQVGEHDPRTPAAAALELLEGGVDEGDRVAAATWAADGMNVVLVARDAEGRGHGGAGVRPEL